MDATEISSVLKDGDPITIALLAGLAAVPLIKGVFAILGTRHQRRKEFLGLWKADSLENSPLWLEEAIQHRYGASIPADLIRHVAGLSWPSKKLRRLALSANFLEMDEAGQTVTWSKKRRGKALWLELEMVASLLGYVGLAALGVALLMVGARQGFADGFMALAFGGVLAIAGGASFMHLILLVEARSSLVIINDAPRKGLWGCLRNRN